MIEITDKENIELMEHQLKEKQAIINVLLKRLGGKVVIDIKELDEMIASKTTGVAVKAIGNRLTVKVYDSLNKNDLKYLIKNEFSPTRELKAMLNDLEFKNPKA